MRHRSQINVMQITRLFRCFVTNACTTWHGWWTENWADRKPTHNCHCPTSLRTKFLLCSPPFGRKFNVKWWPPIRESPWQVKTSKMLPIENRPRIPIRLFFYSTNGLPCTVWPQRKPQQTTDRNSNRNRLPIQAVASAASKYAAHRPKIMIVTRRIHDIINQMMLTGKLHEQTRAQHNGDCTARQPIMLFSIPAQDSYCNCSHAPKGQMETRFFKTWFLYILLS